MCDLPKVGENYNSKLVKLSKVTVADHFDIPNVKKMTNITCLKLVKVISNLFDFDINPAS